MHAGCRPEASETPMMRLETIDMMEGRRGGKRLRGRAKEA